MAYTIAEKAIRFRHSDYNPDRAQKLNSLSMSTVQTSVNTQHYIQIHHAFLSYLANRQTDKCGQTHLPPLLSEVITS